MIDRFFIDSNVLLRLFVKDDEEQTRRAFALVERASSGEIELVTGPPVFFELAWTLGKVYRLSQSRVLEALDAILAHPGLETTDFELAKSAVDLALAANMSFPDSYIVKLAQASGANGIASFNRKHFVRAGVRLPEF
jgi:predicted nucleic acid-binding protein